MSTSNSSPLHEENIRRIVFSYVGPGHWLFLATLSKACKESCEAVDSYKAATLDLEDCWNKYECQPHMTLRSAAFASPACLRLAVQSGFKDQGHTNWSGGFSAGLYGDVSTLQAAHELGLPCTISERAVLGAAQAGSIPKLEWLVNRCNNKLPSSVCDFAARNDNVDTLRWLKERGAVFNQRITEPAARAGHVSVLKYLYEQGCEWSSDTCREAAKHGQLSALKWLHENGCEWDSYRINAHAAGSGSVEVLQLSTGARRCIHCRYHECCC
jgi:hypothetical protein